MRFSVKKFNNKRLSIIVNILALVFFISPFYPYACKGHSDPEVSEVYEMPDSISPMLSSDSLSILTNDSIPSNSKGDTCFNKVEITDTTRLAYHYHRFVDGVNDVLWGDGKTITGFFCVVIGMPLYVLEYGIITAFIFLLICLILRNIYEKRKFVLIAILEFISIPLLFLNEFDVGIIRADQNIRLWGFWICISLVTILFLIDIVYIVKMERKINKNEG